MDYRIALLRDIRALSFFERLLAEETRRRADDDWRYMIGIAGRAAAMALDRLGGLGSPW